MEQVNNYHEMAAHQTDLVCQWLDNIVDDYWAYIERIERRGLFTASTAKRFVYNLWGDKTPEGSGMSKVRWGQVAEFMNSSAIEEGWIGMRIDELKRRNRRAGMHFFSKDTMGFFNSIVYPNTRGVVGDNGQMGGVLFVTSEKYSDSAPRLYTLRYYNLESNMIATLGTFQGFLTLESALCAMRHYKVGDQVAAECDPGVLNNPPPDPALVLAGLPGDDIEAQVSQLLAELGL